MPRNDQITRQWHLLRRLEGSTGLTLRGLVESVPEDYPKNARTVRRDLEALEAVGFPIVADRHNGQTRWKLMEGFRDIPGFGFLCHGADGAGAEPQSFKTAGRNRDRRVTRLRVEQSQEISQLKDGRMTMTLKVADTDELLGWILSFGSQVKVVRPESLMQKVKEEAKNVLGSYR